MAKGKKKDNKKINEDEAWMYDDPVASSSSKKSPSKKKSKAKNDDGLDEETRKRIEEEKIKLMESIGFYADSPIYNSYVKLKKIEEVSSRSNRGASDFVFLHERLRLTALASPFYRIVMGLTEEAELRDSVNRHKNDGRRVKTNEALERRGSF